MQGQREKAEREKMLRHEAQKAETARVFPEHQHCLRVRLSTPGSPMQDLLLF